MRVRENYYALSGEGVNAGTPTQIVRLQGCNLECVWCDTKYSRPNEGGEDWNVLDLVAKTCWPRWALITGGEPLLQESELHELVRGLKARDVCVEIETNGSIAPPTWWTLVTSWSADIKCPSSGMCGKSKLSWTGTRACDQVKFVVQAEEDLSFARKYYASCYRGPTVLISPAYPWSTEWLQRCVEFCKDTSTRLSLQQHKIIYGNRRGV